MNSPTFFQHVPDILSKYAGAIFFISMLVSLLAALVIHSLLRRSRILLEHDWAKPFAWAFYILAARHSLGYFYWLGARHDFLPAYASYVMHGFVAVASAISNYFLFRVGYALTENVKTFISEKILSRFHLTQITARYIAVLLFLVAAFIGMIGELLGNEQMWWTRIPDALISALILGFVGIALYRNISRRRDPLIAWVALTAAISYAALLISFAFHPWIAQKGWADWIVGTQAGLNAKVETLDRLVITLSILSKLGLFSSGYTLMLMTAGPTLIRQLLEEVTDGSAEFLARNGVVRSVQEQIHASRVELYIRLTGTKRNSVVCYGYPSEEGAAEDGKPEELRFDGRTDYGHVLNSGEEVLFRLTNYSDRIPLNFKRTLSSNSSRIAVPIRFHRAVIGCLKVELDEGKFTEADMQNVQRFAALLAPSAQDYREVDALNDISHRLTELHLGAKEYKIQRDIERVANVTDDILAPLATGISIEAGFRRYKASFAKDEFYRTVMGQLLDETYTEAEKKISGDNLNVLYKALKVTSSDLPEEDGQEGGQFFGKLLLATHLKLDDTAPPTLATKFFHRRVISNLITDAVLGFIRGYLNEVTRRLGTRLSSLSEAELPASDGETARGTTVASWFEIVDETAREADVLWAVSTQPDGEALLGEEGELVRRLERQGDWVEKDVHKEYAVIQSLHICTLTPPRKEASHVIRIILRKTAQTLWLGVGNPAFEKEIDYLSPWKGFLLRFGEIADTSLQQIIDRQEQEALKRQAAEMHQIATHATTTATILHQMVNLVRDLATPIAALEDAIKYNWLKSDDEIYEKMILSLSGTAERIEGLTKLFTGVIKPDARRPCSLNEAVQHAQHLLRDSLMRFNIKIDARVPPAQLVDVPFYIVAFTVANLLNNAKDAIRDGGVKDGIIRVVTEETEKTILCQIIDNGPGLPPQVIPRLFKSGVKSDKEHGSGMGLYLSAHSMQESRGDIKLTHRGPNPPTTFTLCFPKPREL